LLEQLAKVFVLINAGGILSKKRSRKLIFVFCFSDQLKQAVSNFGKVADQFHERISTVNPAE